MNCTTRRGIIVDGKARYLDTIQIERLWRLLTCECVNSHASENDSQTKAGIGRWITSDNHQRPHAVHGRQQPAVVCCHSIETDQGEQVVK